MSLLQMSFSGAILITAVTIIRIAAIHKLPKKTFLILWGIVLARLLVPFSVPSTLSAYSYIRSVTSIYTPGSDTGEIANEISNTLAYDISDTASHALADSISVAMPSTRTGRAANEPPNVLHGISAWWLIRLTGTLLCIVFFTISYLRCLMEFQASLPVQNDFIQQWLCAHPLRRPVCVRQSDRISTPLTYGILKPVILMPKKTDWKNTKQLSYILMHEYVHICRFDAMTKLLATLALCIHWFNPFVWVMYLLFNRDLELACDENVIRRLGGASKSAYAFMLIGMEEQRSGLMPFCNSFSKNATEERITAIMKMKKTSLPAIFIAAVLIIFVATAFATSASAKTPLPRPEENTPISANTAFSEEDFDRLLALQFDGYEDMSISEYQDKVWAATDTKEGNDLLERFFADESLYAAYETKADTDSRETAYFLYNILAPLTAESWSSRIFRDYSVSAFAQAKYPDTADNATLEYTITLTILNPDSLTVGQYDATRIGVMDGLNDILQNKSIEQLQDEAFMQKAIATETETLTGKWSTDKLQVTVEYFYTPLVLLDKGSENSFQNTSLEPERHDYSNATEEDYRSLLTLKTADYQNMSVSAFNMALLDWANENYERMERISIDTSLNDYAVSLSDEEMTFVSLTVWASGMENGEYIRSLYKSEPVEDPAARVILPDKEEYENDYTSAYCSMEYSFSYHTIDKESVTIRERDRCISDMIGSVQKFWDETDIDDALAMSKDDIVEKLEKIARQCSNDNIKISILTDRVHFEHMDERNID